MGTIGCGPLGSAMWLWGKLSVLPKGSLPRMSGVVSPEGNTENRMATKKYEALYIVKPDLSDADVQKIADRYKGVVETNGGTVESAGKWDKRKLAYEINGLKEGNYILMYFEAPPKVPAELSRLLGISDDIVRHRIYIRENLEEVSANPTPVAAE